MHKELKLDNIRQKNIILADQQVESRPYGKAENVQLPTPPIQNFPDTYEIDINNCFHQMVDNDLYNENAILRLKRYTDGIKSSDPEKIQNGPDGYKFARDDDSILNFYRKVVVPPQDTV